MQQITIDLQTNIAQKFNTYIELFGSKDLLFDKFIEYQINRIKREIARMQTVLEKYEKKYNLKTSEFYKQFQNGELGDENDYMLWAGIYELQLDSKTKLAKFL